MRKVTLAGLILLMAIASWSQEREYKTIVDFNDVRISGMGGVFMQFTAADGEFAHMLGGGGAVLLGDFFFGAYGLGLTNQIPVDRPNLPDYQTGDKLTISHGGFWLGYSLFGDRAIHMNFSSLVGWGTLGVRSEYYPENLWPDGIFVLSPTMEVELNLTKFFRLGVGASYNIYTFVDLPGYTASDFSAPGGFLSFKFGWF
ncbi:MAG: hypothetical protein R6W31_13965 [Bacteroidales bacterium]